MQVTNSPVYDEYQRQRSRDNSALVDLTALWDAAGRPKGRSPRQWAAREERRRGEGPILASNGGPGRPVLASSDVALDFAMVLDSKIQMAANEVFWTRLHADPVRCLIKCPDPLLALFAIVAVADSQGVSGDEAAKVLVDEVVERTADLDPYAQETTVAKVQRAVRREPGPIDDTGGR